MKCLHFSLVALFFCLAFSQITPTSCSTSFTINILALNNTLITPVLQRHATRWSKSSDVAISFKWVLGLDELQNEMYESLNSNGDAMDGFLFPSSWLGNTYDSLANLANSIKSEVFWDDVRNFVQATAEFNGTDYYGVPLGSQVLMLYYRQDLLEKFDLAVPNTWNELVSVVKAMAGRDFSDDGFPDFPICFSNEDLPSAFLSIFVPFVQTLGYAHGAFFNSHMAPLLNHRNPAFEKALSIWDNLVGVASNFGTADTRSLFLSGRCAILIDWVDVVHSILESDFLQDKWNVTRIPGTTEVYDPATRKLTQCRRSLCPYSDVDLINYAPYSGVGCWLGGINDDSPDRVQKAVYSFWVYIASQQSGNDAKAGAFYPYRISQFANESLWTGFDPIWNDFLEQLYLSLYGNTVLGLRILSTNQYLNVIENNLKEFNGNRQSKTETALKIEQGWDDITDSVGKDVQSELYFASLNLPSATTASSDSLVKSKKGKTQTSSGGGTNLFLAILLPISLFVVLVIVGFTAGCIIQRRRLKREVYTAIQRAKKDTSWQIDISKLELKERIGLGSFGEVYRGFYRGTEVAVKRLRETHLTDKLLQEFICETQILCELRHPNVVLFMGACTEPPNACIVTEYMPQGSLYDVLHNDSIPLDWKLIKNMAMDAARGMDYLHSSTPPVLHRDFKSLNLLVDQKWNLKVADFGLTGFKDTNKNNDRIGTLLWTAPEVLKCEPYTEKSDVYSYGIVLWELLTRKDPYEGLNRNYVTVGVIGGLRPEMLPHIPASVQELIRDCWDTDPDKRPTFKQIRTRLTDLEFATLNGSLLASGSFSFSPKSSGFPSLNHSLPPDGGTVTIVFTNLSGYDALWQSAPQEMQEAILLHITILRRLMNEYNGFEVNNENDSFMFIFPEHKKAAKFCLVAQEEFLLASWPKRILDHDLAAEKRDANGALVSRGLKIRMGMHSGEPHCTVDAITGRREYFGSVVNTAAKVTSFAEMGEILLTKETKQFISKDMDYMDYPVLEEVNPRNGETSVFYRLTPQALKGRRFSGVREIGSLGSAHSSDGWTNQLDKISSNLHKRWIIPYEEIVLESKIGEGSFGEVFKGKWRGSELAVKRLFRQQADARILLELRKESVIMSSLRHPNILLFLGVCITPPNLCILTEYMRNGSLGPFLRNKSNKLSWTDRLNMGKQTAIGMDYLHSLKPPLIHRDLTSYNILVDKNLRCKIGDFGLSRIKEQNATMTRCGTVSWTAPEILKGLGYSEKSDVYSFGIVLWELFTREKPYKGLEATVVLQSVIDNYRPPIPADCPSEYIKLVQQCWDGDPSKRPSFEKVMARLEKMEQDLKLNRSYNVESL